MKRFPNRSRCFPAAILAVLGLNASMAQESPDDVVVLDDHMWALETSAAVPWREAEEFCETLESGGFSDWRLPTLAQLESLYDAATDSIRTPFDLEDCCAWSSLNLEDLEAEAKGELPDPGGPPSGYYWGFLFSGGVSYYSNGRFADGFALCLRDANAV